MGLMITDDLTGERVLVDKNIIEKSVNKHVQPETKLEYIPRDPDEFLLDFGGIPHPNWRDENNNPIIITKWTPYQREYWMHKGDLCVIKGNKLGLTTSFSLEDFQSRLLPEEAGGDCLLVAQSEEMAREHIKDLKRLIRGSKKYSKYLIERPEQEAMLEEKSKISVAYIMNQYNRRKPSRIIGIGSAQGKVFSWKYINRVHMSDISVMNKKDQKTFFAGIYSRLLNTGGPCKIESIPNGQMGEVYRIYLKSKIKEKELDEEMKGELVADPEERASKFTVKEVLTREAIPYGLIKGGQRGLDILKRELGDLVYSQTCECAFIAPGNQFYKPGWLTKGSYTL